jgi:hypothetical protein
MRNLLFNTSSIPKSSSLRKRSKRSAQREDSLSQGGGLNFAPQDTAAPVLRLVLDLVVNLIESKPTIGSKFIPEASRFLFHLKDRDMNGCP